MRDSYSEAAHEVYDLPLCPAAVIPIGLGEKRAMAAVRALHECQIRICGDFPPRLGKDTNKRVIGSVENQPGNRNLAHHIRSRCARVIIDGALEPAVVGRNLVVEVAQAPDTAKPFCIEMARE